VAPLAPGELTVDAFCARGGALIVVTGLPRSGTSMAMRMLAAGGLPIVADGARPADAGNPHGYFEDLRVKRLREDAAWLASCGGRAVKIVLPLLPHVPRELCCDVIAVRRPIAEVLASQRELLALAGVPSEPGDDAVLASAFARCEAQAIRWWSGRQAVRVLEVEYAGVVCDPTAASRRIAGFLERGLDAAAMAAAVDPSLHRHRSAP
jgi:hypothetical protein